MKTTKLLLIALAFAVALPAVAQQTYKIGDVITFSDGTQGFVFHLNRERTAGTVVAMQDEQPLAWAATNDVLPFVEAKTSSCLAVSSTDGYANTCAVRYAADWAGSQYSYYLLAYWLNIGENTFARGWYAPAEGQLRQVVSAMSLESFEEAERTFTTQSTDHYSSDWNSSFNPYYVRTYTGLVQNASAFRNKNFRAVRDFPEQASVRITVASSNEAMGRGIGTDDYMPGHLVHIGAKPAQGCHFVQWNDGNTDNPREIAVGESAATYTATFAPASDFSIATAPCDAAMGSTSGSGSYAWGNTATLEAVASAGYRFVRWSDGNTDNPRQITICADSTFTAAFISEDARPVHPGDILCTDGATVTPKDYYAYKNAHNGVSAKGVVYYVDDSGQHGFVVRVQGNSSYYWGINNLDIPEITTAASYRDAKVIMRDMDGAGNTDAYLRFYGDIGSPATYCRSFGPEWFWASGGQCNILRGYLPEVMEGIGAIRNAGETCDAPIGTSGFYGSTESTYSKAGDQAAYFNGSSVSSYTKANVDGGKCYILISCTF